MTVAITGATGFVGTRLVQTLLEGEETILIQLVTLFVIYRVFFCFIITFLYCLLVCVRIHA